MLPAREGAAGGREGQSWELLKLQGETLSRRKGQDLMLSDFCERPRAGSGLRAACLQRGSAENNKNRGS